jgi:hypothetical protein
MGLVLRATCATRRNPIAPPAVEAAGRDGASMAKRHGFCWPRQRLRRAGGARFGGGCHEHGPFGVPIASAESHRGCIAAKLLFACCKSHRVRSFRPAALRLATGIGAVRLAGVEQARSGSAAHCKDGRSRYPPTATRPSSADLTTIWKTTRRPEPHGSLPAAMGLGYSKGRS